MERRRRGARELRLPAAQRRVPEHVAEVLEQDEQLGTRVLKHAQNLKEVVWSESGAN